MCIIAAFALDGQHLYPEWFEHLKFRSVGPAGMSGRVTAIDVYLSDQEHILVGTASGGLWESKDGGITWQPIFDEAPTQAIGSVKFNQRNPLEIWVGTGEGNPRNSHNSGTGVFKTLDGGKTWEHLGLENSRTIHRLLIDPHDPDVVYAGVHGNAWGPSADRGVFKTADGGKTWKKILYVNDRTGVADMVMDPRNHKKLIVAMWEYWRKPWEFHSGGKGSGLYVTVDAGENWRQITDNDGLPKGDLGRIGLAQATNKPNIVYALVEAKVNGLYKSVDGGLKWSLVSTKNIGDRPFYYHELYVDPSNENRIWNLYTYVSKSEDGGKTFETVLDYGKGVHPDHHAFWVSPTNPRYLIDGNDGGLNISRDGGKNWYFVANLPVGQFYHVNVDMNYPYNIYGGLQDNGTWVGPSYVLKAGGIRNSDWREVLFGDGFDVMPYRGDTRYGWAMSQGGNLSFYDYETGFSEFQKPVHPDNIPLRFNWNAALAQNPFHDCGIYYGSQFVHKSMDCGRSWKVISPDLTTNDSTKHVSFRSGGLTPDVTSAENHTTILAIAPSPVDEQVIWVGTDDGNLQITRDGGATWTSLSGRMPGFPPNGWIPQIEVSVKNPGEAFVVVNNYRQDDWAPYLYHTSDFGQSFRRLVRPGDIGSFVCSVVQDPVEPNLVFLGADDGLYVSFNGGTTWQKWYHKGLPSVQIMDMKIHPVEHDLILGTFGRAFQVLDDIRPLREIARTKGEVLNRDFAVFLAPDATLSQYRSVDGVRFTADAEFKGDNRSRGARFTVWKKPQIDVEQAAVTMTPQPVQDKRRKTTVQPLVAPTTEVDTAMAKQDDVEKKDERLKVTVLGMYGDTVRKFTRRIEPGFNRLSWDMRRTGVRYPSRQDPREDADDPGGREVLPGIYRLVVQYGQTKDSTLINVRRDPRLKLTDDDLAERDLALADLETTVSGAARAFEQLKNAKKTVDLIDKAIVNAPDSTQKEVRKLGKDLQKKIDALMELFMNPEDAKGIQYTADKLQSIIRSANSYFNSSAGNPGENAAFAASYALSRLRVAIERINTFIETDWQSYRETMQVVDFELFSAVEKVNLDDQ
jgi:photosystem II stability/assembly factor-like uncharacterized protein